MRSSVMLNTVALVILCFAVLLAEIGGSPANDKALEDRAAAKEDKELADLLKTLIHETKADDQKTTSKRQKASDTIRIPGQENADDSAEQDIPIDTMRRDYIPDPAEHDIRVDTEQRDNIPNEVEEEASGEIDQRDAHLADDTDEGAQGADQNDLAMDGRAVYRDRNNLCRYMSRQYCPRCCNINTVKSICKATCRTIYRDRNYLCRYMSRQYCPRCCNIYTVKSICKATCRSKSTYFYLGSSVTNRRYLDSWRSSVYVLPYQKAISNGQLRSWRFFAKKSGTIYLQIWRGSSSSFKLVGQTKYYATGGRVNTVLLRSNGSRRYINILRNDVIGFHFPGNSIIPFDGKECYSRRTLYIKGVYSPLTIGRRYTFRYKQTGWNPCRTYSIRATVARGSYYG